MTKYNLHQQLYLLLLLTFFESQTYAQETANKKILWTTDALRIWDKAGNLISVGNSKDYLWGVSWNKKGNRIVTSSTEQRLILWNNKARKKITIE